MPGGRVDKTAGAEIERSRASRMLALLGRILSHIAFPRLALDRQVGIKFMSDLTIPSHSPSRRHRLLLPSNRRLGSDGGCGDALRIASYPPRQVR